MNIFTLSNSHISPFKNTHKFTFQNHTFLLFQEIHNFHLLKHKHTQATLSLNFYKHHPSKIHTSSSHHFFQNTQVNFQTNINIHFSLLFHKYNFYLSKLYKFYISEFMYFTISNFIHFSLNTSTFSKYFIFPYKTFPTYTSTIITNDLPS
ncbi:hypothetical protein KFK09_017686 [Dendrobium nobile]|uniref:Uncharacterized protein n=1 Tax=Dendrobium nobile TaxID=94219 RepID=A0A8T3AUT3_DENNO|nr:hypothetical protein KFK09_017686 [Dendrobium nobile]